MAGGDFSSGGSICQSSLVNLSQTASEYRGTGERASLSKGEERFPLGPSGGGGGICRRISAGDLGWGIGRTGCCYRTQIPQKNYGLKGKGP